MYILYKYRWCNPSSSHQPAGSFSRHQTSSISQIHLEKHSSSGWHICAFTPNWVRFSPSAGCTLPQRSALRNESTGLCAPVTDTSDTLHARLYIKYSTSARERIKSMFKCIYQQIINMLQFLGYLPIKLSHQILVP